MPKKPKQKSALTIVRDGLGLSQPEFARRLGVSASIIKKIEEGKRAMSQDLTTRIFAETGVMFVSGRQAGDAPCTYTKADHAEWLKETTFNSEAAKAASRLVLKLAELMLIAAARPGVNKSYQAFNAIMQALEKVKTEFQLERHVEAELRERHSTQTKLYTVRELRGNDLLAKMVNFKDDPKLRDDDTLPLTKTTGWLPTKEQFNIFWRHRELLAEIAKTPPNQLTEEAKAKLVEIGERMENELNREVDTFAPFLAEPRQS